MSHTMSAKRGDIAHQIPLITLSNIKYKREVAPL